MNTKTINIFETKSAYKIKIKEVIRNKNMYDTKLILGDDEILMVYDDIADLYQVIQEYLESYCAERE